MATIVQLRLVCSWWKLWWCSFSTECPFALHFSQPNSLNELRERHTESDTSNVFVAKMKTRISPQLWPMWTTVHALHSPPPVCMTHSYKHNHIRTSTFDGQAKIDYFSVGVFLLILFLLLCIFFFFFSYYYVPLYWCEWIFLFVVFVVN